MVKYLTLINREPATLFAGIKKKGEFFSRENTLQNYLMVEI